MICVITSPSQSKDEFCYFLFSLDQLLSNIIGQNPTFPLVTSDVNAINSSRWKNNCVSREGNEAQLLTCSY